MLIEDAGTSTDTSALYERYEKLLAGHEAPFAFVDLDAMFENGERMLARCSEKPIRIASKSLRCAPIQKLILERDDRYSGTLTFTLPESLWLAEQGFKDLVIAYPTVDRTALAKLAELAATDPESAPTVMVDSIEHIDLIESVCARGGGPIRVAIEADAGYWALGGRLKFGPKRSPIRSPEQARALAEAIVRRAALRLAGMMLYEGQTAGVGDAVPGQFAKNFAVRMMQKSSASELAERRAAIVEAVQRVAPLEFVNGGGTGSLHLTSCEEAVTELAAGSGFYAPTLFDGYRAFDLAPAAMFVLPVVRKPSPSIATALGGGYLASGVGGKDRMPTPYLPAGLKLDALEGAGEVQTPLHGRSAKGLTIGDRVYFRHTKAGELCERFNTLLLVQGDRVVDEVETYRGQGKAFL